MKITKLCILAIMIIVGMAAKATGISAYCGYLMGSTEAQKAFLTIETDGSGNIVMTIAPYNGDNNTAFRNSGYGDGAVTAFTVNGNANTANRYFTRTINLAKTQITFTPVPGMMHDGDVVVFNQIIEYKTSKDTNLWPTFTFTYTYGTSCAGAPNVTLTPMSINFTPTQGVKTFTLTGVNLTSNLTLTASKGLIVSPTTISPESDGTIGVTNQTVTVTWGSGSTSGGYINISGGGLVITKNETVTSSGFSEFCNTVISQDNDGTSNLAYLTVGTSTDKTQVILAIDPYDTNTGATAKWKGLGTIKVNNVTQTPTITYNNNTTKTAATLTFASALSNGDIVTFGGALVWELTGTLWNNTNCYINASKTYTVGFGCSLAQVDITLPVVANASNVSATSYNAIIGVNATDNIGVTNIHFVDTANGINVTQLAKSDNGTANYTISNLQGNTAYSFVITALDLAGNETAIGNAKTVALTTLHTPQITATPGSLDFTPTTGSKTFTLAGAYVTESIQLSAPAGYIITPSTLTPTAGIIAATTVTINWINGLGNKIVVSGGGLENPVKLIDLTYSIDFSSYCNKIIYLDGTTNWPANMNISMNDSKTAMTFTIAPYNIGETTIWNRIPNIVVNGGTTNALVTSNVLSSDKKQITITFSQALQNNDLVTFGNPMVWEVTGIQSNNNVFINALQGPYTVGTSCNVTSFNVTTNSNISNLSCLNCDIIVNSGVLLNIDQSKTYKDISVYPGAKLTLGSGKTLTVNSILLKSDATGTATLLDEGGTLTATTATVQQYLPTARNWYISSPITTKVVPTGSTYFGYQESGDNSDLSVSGSTAYWKPYTEGTSLPAGKGYIAQPTGETTLAFNGTLNTGSTTVQLSRTTLASKPGFNLVGNPYPSYLDWSMVATANTNVLPTAWFRTKKGDGTYTFSTVNVAVPATPVIVTNNANTTITKYIPPMQAYWVRLNENPSTSNYTVTNAMRAHIDDAGNKFKIPKQNNMQLIRFLVSNGTNSDETVLYFNEDASNSFDRYDSPKMTNANPAIPEIYTVADNNQLVINGLNSQGVNKELPLGFYTGATNTFSIKASEVTNFDANMRVILRDKLMNTEFDITDGTAYNFSSDIANTTSRFSIIFKVTSVNTEVKNTFNQSVNIYLDRNNHIEVNYNGANSPNANVTISNAIGQVLLSMPFNEKNNVINKSFVAGVYFVTVNAEGKSVTKKLIIN